MTQELTTFTARRFAATLAVVLGALAALSGAAIVLGAGVFLAAEGAAMLAGAGILVLLVGLALLGLGIALRSHLGSGVTGVAPAAGATAYFARLWAGDVPLGITFWLWGVCLNIVVALPYLNTAHPAFLVLHAAYWCAVSVPIWRSSARYQGSSLWSTLARAYVVLGLLRIAVAVPFAFAFS
jgi:hypothetical protein